MSEGAAFAGKILADRIFVSEGYYITWPDAATLKAQKSFLREGVEMGMFEKEAAGLIDGMYAP